MSVQMCRRRRIPSLDQAPPEHQRQHRFEAIAVFMVSVSDQIMVSQAAILVAAIARNKITTIYSVNVLIALTVLASTVQLATFKLLSTGLRKYSVSKHIRVFLMLSGSILLIFLLLIQLSDSWKDGTNVFFLCALRSFHLGDGNVISFAMDITVPLTVLYNTCGVVHSLYSRLDGGVQRQPDVEQGTGQSFGHVGNGERPQSGGRQRSLQSPERLHDRDLQQQQAGEQGAGQGSEQLDEDSAGHVTSRDGQNHREERLGCHDVRSPSRYDAAKRAIRLWWDIDFSQLRKIRFQTRVAKLIKGGIPTRRRQATLGLTMETWAFEECQDSYAWKILWLLSANTYGITSVFEARADSDGMSGNPNELGFGQIVPLALLLLPVISATQSISGKLAVVVQ